MASKEKAAEVVSTKVIAKDATTVSRVVVAVGVPNSKIRTQTVAGVFETASKTILGIINDRSFETAALAPTRPVPSVRLPMQLFKCEGNGRRRGAFLCPLLLVGHSYTFGHPRRRLRLHPIQSFDTGLKFVYLLDRAIGPLGLYFPMLAIFEDHTKYRSSRRHVFTHAHMTARRE